VILVKMASMKDETQEMTPKVPETQSARAGVLDAAGCFKWAVLSGVAVALIAGGVAWKFIETSAGLAQGVGDFFHQMADRLHTRSVEETFRERITQVVSTEGDILELARVEAEESFTRSDSRSFFGNMVYLGTTISEIRVPVVFRYHLKLSDEWQIVIEDQEVRVLAPMLRPSLPPAIRTDGMEKKSDSGWLRFNAAENLAQLEKGLTPQMERRAGDKRHLDLAREASRKSVEQFVRKWVLESHPDIGQMAVKVTFPDEVDQTRNVQPGKGVTP
jgi:hypothetical protein